MLSASEAILGALYALLSNFEEDMVVVCRAAEAKAVLALADADKLIGGEFIGPVRELMDDRCVSLEGGSAEMRNPEVFERVRRLALEARLQDAAMVQQENPPHA